MRIFRVWSGTSQVVGGCNRVGTCCLWVMTRVVFLMVARPPSTVFGSLRHIRFYQQVYCHICPNMPYLGGTNEERFVNVEARENGQFIHFIVTNFVGGSG